MPQTIIEKSFISPPLQTRLQGEPVNLREQHDACEFYNILVESLNEALKALGHEQIMNKILGGSYSDQKICKTCPHRYWCCNILIFVYMVLDLV